MEILFENSNFIVVDKEAGFLSVPSRMGDKDARPVLGKVLQETLGLQIFPVHRLDCEVSGCVLYAKNAKAHREANQAFEQHWVQKTYEALCLQPSQDIALNSKEIWRSKLLRGKKRAYESPLGKDSITEATAIEFCPWKQQRCLLWHLKPITGRSHQLRFEMSKHGFSILGDALYASTVVIAKDTIALRAVKIDFREAQKNSLLKDLPEEICAASLRSRLKSLEQSPSAQSP